MATLTITPTHKQHLVYEALKNPETIEVFFGGGAGGGKSWIICESRLIHAIRFPGYRSFIGREELKRLMQSTYITWTKVCKHHGIPKDMWKLNGQYNYIEFENGSRIDLLDLKMLPGDPMFERLGSLEYTDGAVDEAPEVNFLAIDVLKSRLGRHMNKEFGVHPTLLCSGNPSKSWPYREYYKPWKEKKLPKGIVFIQSLYQDNPHTAQEYGQQLSQIKDKVTKERLMFGNWEYDIDDNALMSYDLILDLFTNTVPVSPHKYLVADIARYGGDKVVIGLWRGLKLTKVWEYQKQGIDTTAIAIREIMREEQVPYSHCVVDDDGVGGGVVDVLRGIKGFVNNSSPIDVRGVKQNYQNLKTQCQYMLAEYVQKHQIAIGAQLSDIQRGALIEELEQIKRFEPDKDRKLRTVPKEKVKELLGRSPDWSDMVMMRMFFELQKPVYQEQLSSDEVASITNVY